MKFRDKSLIGVCPAGRERSYGGMPKAGRCPKYCFFLRYARKNEKKCEFWVLLFYTGIRAVNSHKTNIFNKLGLSSSVEMVRFALEHGII